jgi:hypothetical protein
LTGAGDGTVKKKARYDEIIRQEPAALTTDQAVYILGFRDADALSSPSERRAA